MNYRRTEFIGSRFEQQLMGRSLRKRNLKSSTLPPKKPSFANPAEELRAAQQQLQEAETLRQKKFFDKAEVICSHLIRQYPDYYGALHTLGLIYADKGQHQRAVQFLVQAAIQHPRSWITQTALAGSYLNLDSEDLAAQALERAVTIKPDSPEVLITLGEVYESLRDYEPMLTVYKKALELEPDRVEAAWGVSKACIELGDFSQASSVLSSLIDLKHNSLALLENLTQLPASFACENLDSLIKSVHIRDVAESQASFLFVQARASAINGNSEKAWKLFSEANRAKLKILGENNLESSLTSYKQRLNWLQDNTNAGRREPESKDPGFTSLFILGPSRSGKTTAEKLLSSHSGVLRGYENPTISKAIKQTFMDAGLLSWQQTANLPYYLRDHVSENYIELLNFDASKYSVFTNTSPGLIWDAIFLNEFITGAKYIFLDRNVDDLAMDIFMKNYRRGHTYSYKLEKTYEFIGLYKQMVEIMESRIPEKVLILNYDDLIKSPRECFDRMVAFAGLDRQDCELPELGDNRGVSAQYRKYMDQTSNRVS